MVDSTYTVASNPNTMRDTGALRNSEYVTKDRAENSKLHRSFIAGTNTKALLGDSENLKSTLQERCPHKKPQAGLHTSHMGVLLP
jgi:hypothetical protein